MTMRVFVFDACLKKVAATGWFSVGFAPMTMTTSESAHAVKGAVTAPEPIPSRSATTDDAWQRRVQWSTLLVPNPVRIIFWTRYASSFDPLAEPNPARAPPPSRSRMRARPAAARSRASSQPASRKWVQGFAGSIDTSADFGASSRRTRGRVRRSGWAT